MTPGRRRYGLPESGATVDAAGGYRLAVAHPNSTPEFGVVNAAGDA